MKGLLLKDIYNLKNQWKYMLFIAVVFSLSFASNGDGTLASMFTFICTILLLNSLAQDEMDQWNKFAFTLPVTRRQAILAKYIFGLLLCCLGLACGIGLTLLTRAVGLGDGGMSFGGVLVEALASCGVVLLIVSLMVPMNLKFGIQKSRYLLMGFVAVPVLLSVAITSLGVTFAFGSLFEISPLVLGSGAVLLVAAVMTVSFFISVRIMEKKEF